MTARGIVFAVACAAAAYGQGMATRNVKPAAREKASNRPWPSQLTNIARQAGLDLQRFADLCLDISGEKTQAHMAASRTLLNRLGGHGFPTFALQSGADRFAVLDVGPFLGDAAAWQESLARAVAQAGGRIEAGRPDSAGGPVCDAQGCALPARG